MIAWGAWIPFCLAIIAPLVCGGHWLTRGARHGLPGMHVVHTSISSYRLLAMSMDEDGFIWSGSVHRVIHRFDPHTGRTLTIRLPYDANASACICANGKVYILGQSYPRLMIYDRASEQFREIAYPSPKPDVWYGTEPIQKRYIYLFDRGSVGVIKWDTKTDTGTTIEYPYPTPLPSNGHFEAKDHAIWCKLWDYTGGQYVPVGIARLDTRTDRFTGWYPYPKEDANLLQFKRPSDTFFLPYTLKGMLVPFDFKEKRWCKFIPVPRFGELFGFIGGSVLHGGRHYFSLSTYDGDDIGCDGKPYHFCNAVLEFDPSAREFRFPTLEVEDAYYQMAYMLSARGKLYVTGSNIREPDGTLNQARAGEVVFWQPNGR